MEVLLQKKGKWLVPAEPQSDEVVAGIKDGEVVSCNIKRPRNINHHRLFFALMNEVYLNQSRYATMDHMLIAIKVAIGHYDEQNVNGRAVVIPRSISFAKMDQNEFRNFYDKVVEMVVTKLLPNTTKEDLERRIMDIIGGNNERDATV